MVPDGWEIVNLGSIGEFANGINKCKEDFGFGFRFVNLQDVFGVNEILKSPLGLVNATAEELDRYSLKEGDVLFVRSSVKPSGVGLTAVVTQSLKDTVYSGFLIRFRQSKAKLITPFLKFCFYEQRFRQKLLSCSSVSANTNINQKSLEKLTILIPPQEEQKKIAAILSSVDEAIASTQAVIDQTHKVKQGLLQQLLTRGIGHTKFKPLPDWIVGRISGISKIPQEWNLVSILDVARLESGHTPSRDKDEYWNGTIPWISLHDSKFLDKRVITETAMYVTELGIKNSSARILPAGTVVFSRTASVGHCVIMGREMATSQDFANYICGENLHNRYLMHLFRWIQPVWNGLASGSVHSTIYMPAFKQLKILLPPLFEQIKIAEIVDCFDNVIEDNNNKLEQLSILKRGLMQDLLTGRVRVKSA